MYVSVLCTRWDMKTPSPLIDVSYRVVWSLCPMSVCCTPGGSEDRPLLPTHTHTHTNTHTHTHRHFPTPDTATLCPTSVCCPRTDVWYCMALLLIIMSTCCYPGRQIPLKDPCMVCIILALRFMSVCCTPGKIRKYPLQTFDPAWYCW